MLDGHPRRRGGGRARRRQPLGRRAGVVDHVHRSSFRPRCVWRRPPGSPPTMSYSTSDAESAARFAPWRRSSAVKLVGVDDGRCILRGRRRAQPTQRARRSDRDPHGRRLSLPCDDAEFTVAWTQHASMNIARKAQMYAEMRRVLVTGGRLAFFDVLAGGSSPPLSPCRGPTATLSVLATAEETRRFLTEAGFAIRLWDDVTDAVADYVAALAGTTERINGLGIQIVMPDIAEQTAGPRPKRRRGPGDVHAMRRRRNLKFRFHSLASLAPFNRAHRAGCAGTEIISAPKRVGSTERSERVRSKLRDGGFCRGFSGDLVDDRRCRDLARAAASPPDGDDLSLDEELASPHTEGLGTLEGPAEAQLAHRAAGADRLRPRRLGRVLGEEQRVCRWTAGRHSVPTWRSRASIG